MLSGTHLSVVTLQGSRCVVSPVCCLDINVGHIIGYIYIIWLKIKTAWGLEHLQKFMSNTTIEAIEGLLRLQFQLTLSTLAQLQETV